MIQSLLTRSQTDSLQAAIARMAEDSQRHARWLNIGDRKIAGCEHPVAVTPTILKHAAEEFRHALHLKRQIPRIGELAHRQTNLIASSHIRAYLHRLDLEVCRYVEQECQLDGLDLRHHAYLLVTWAIEVRAGHLYPIYQQLLEDAGSRASVRSIIAEEQGHREEMERLLEKSWGPTWLAHARVALDIEADLFQAWTQALVDESSS